MRRLFSYFALNADYLVALLLRFRPRSAWRMVKEALFFWDGVEEVCKSSEAPPKPLFDARSLPVGERFARHAKQFVGVEEELGERDGKDVERFLGDFGGVRGDYWSGAFVCHIVHRSSIYFNVKPKLFLSKQPIYMATHTIKEYGTDIPRWESRVGDIIVLQEIEAPWKGHALIIADGPDEKGNFYTVEGDVCGKVIYGKRNYFDFGSKHCFYAFLRPFD